MLLSYIGDRKQDNTADKTDCVLAFLRGGNWNNDTNAGVETLNLNNAPGNTNNNIGFRCARYSYANIYAWLTRYGLTMCHSSVSKNDYWRYSVLRVRGVYAPLSFLTCLRKNPSRHVCVGEWVLLLHTMNTPTYKTLSSFEHLYYAYRRARKLRKSKRCVLLYEKNLERNLGTLSYILRNKIYTHGPYREFVVRDSKKRRIKAAPFRDRIVHHAVCALIEPLFEKRFIYDSYVCRKKKGTHRAVKRLRTFMYSVSCGYTRPAYYVRLDVSKYFKSIDHDILFSLLCRVVDDKDIRSLLREIIRSSCDSCVEGRKKGIPIGNLTSQLFANVYLNELDHYIKEQLHVRYYIRYMDDIVMCDTDKMKLTTLRLSIVRFLSEILLLSVHPGKIISAPIELGIPFLGYILFPHHTRLRGATVKRCMKRMKKYNHIYAHGGISPVYMQSLFASWRGYAHHAQAWNISQKVKNILYTRIGD